MPVSFLGIRHHGPGSSRHVVEYLKQFKPDLILIEGPGEAEELLPFLYSPDLKPPFAMLAYQIERTKNAVFYPFAVFSPEWAALQYAKNNNVQVRFMDLPLTHSLALIAKKEDEELERQEQAQKEAEAAEQSNSEQTQAKDAALNSDSADSSENTEKAVDSTDVAENAAEATEDAAEDTEDADDSAENVAAEVVEDAEFDDEDCDFSDPFDYLAKISGLSDGETWWDVNVEQRIGINSQPAEIFEAVNLAVTELRDALPEHTSERDLVREAWMRKVLRTAQKEYQNIAVVCGAWHVPALAKMPTLKEDNARLKGLPKTKTSITLVPWTYSRLSYASGYGAGILSPGWYHHLYFNFKDDGTRWLTKVTKELRKEGRDISVAHVIETLRLAQTLAAMRGQPRPSLDEFNEAITTVMGFGDNSILALINRRLVISDRLGKVPDGVPKVPLLSDIEQQQKKLRVPFTAEPKDMTLDLRKPLDLERSIFFNRMKMLGIGWAKLIETSSTNTFKEVWRLTHNPEQIIKIIECAIYGTSLQEALTSYTQEKMHQLTAINDLTELLDELIPCDLPELVDALTARLDILSATSSDMLQLIRTVSPLVKILRYGSVRKFDSSAISNMLYTMMGRILAGGVLICINIDAEEAQDIEKALRSADYALKTLANEELLEMWLEFVEAVQQVTNVHALLSGAALRILREHQILKREDLERAISYYTSFSNDPKDMAFWLEGFLKDSGLVLVHDDELWMLVNNFLVNLEAQQFIELLPILRRTFAEFSDTERRQLGNKAQNYHTGDIQPALGSMQRAEGKQGDSDSSIVRVDAALEQAVSVIGYLLNLELPAPFNQGVASAKPDAADTKTTNQAGESLAGAEKTESKADSSKNATDKDDAGKDESSSKTRARSSRKTQTKTTTKSRTSAQSKAVQAAQDAEQTSSAGE